MKITKTRLKQIIKEELSKELSEGFADMFKSKKRKAAEAQAAQINSDADRLADIGLTEFHRDDIIKALEVIANSEKPKEIGRLHRAMNAMKDGNLEQAKQLLDNLIKNIPDLKGLLPSVDISWGKILSPHETRKVIKYNTPNYELYPITGFGYR